MEQHPSAGIDRAAHDLLHLFRVNPDTQPPRAQFARRMHRRLRRPTRFACSPTWRCTMSRNHVSRSRAMATAANFEPLEDRTLYAAELRSFDGTGNNLSNPAWGSAGAALLRLAQA